MMKKLISALAILVMLAACGGETTATDEADTQTANDQAETGDSADQDQDQDQDQESFGDLPSECRELLADYLRGIEPTVSNIDWDTATMDDLDSVSTEMDAATENFSAEVDDNAECANLNAGSFVNDSFDQMLGLAKDEAPGTVDYLEFLFGMLGTLDSSLDDDGESGTEAEGCDGALAKLAELANDYSSAAEAPVAELTAAQSGIMSCSGAQLLELSETYGDFLDS